MVIAIVALAVIALVFAVAYITYRIAFYAPSDPKKRKEDIYDIPKSKQYDAEWEKMVRLITEMDALPYERVFITAFDEVRLSGRYYHFADGAPLRIQFHGYRGTAVRDFCGGNEWTRAHGQNTLVVDQRAHGQSGGNTITFGIKERRDCLSWVEYACKRFGADTKIYLSGVSMGAATVLMATELELPKNVLGIVADCPYSSPEEVIKKECKNMGFAPWLAMPFLRLGARVFGGFSIRETTAVEAVKKATVPILLIHGEGDLLVPCEMSEKIYHACASEKQLVTFPEAAHGISYIMHTEAYWKVVEDFVARCEKGGDKATEEKKDEREERP